MMRQRVVVTRMAAIIATTAVLVAVVAIVMVVVALIRARLPGLSCSDSCRLNSMTRR